MRAASILFLTVLAFIGIGAVLDGDETAPGRATVAIGDLKAGFGPRDFSDAIETANSNVAAKRARLATAPDEWLHAEILALALMERHRLDPRPAGLEEAEQLIDRAFGLAPDPSGPNLTRAALALSLHRLDEAEAALARFGRTVAPFKRDRAEAAAMRGDLAFQRGDIREAKRFYQVSHRIDSSIGTSMRLANLALWSGQPKRASEIFEARLSGSTPIPADFAALALFQANLAYARGNLDRAGEWIEAANGKFAGYWLAEAYAAQQRAAKGDFSRAIEDLHRLATKTNDPGVMDSLTGLLFHVGRDTEARAWATRAGEEWTRLVAAHPDAYRLHAAEHHLDFGDPVRALAMARIEVTKRPFGDAIEVLASALNANGRPAEALGWLERADAKGWRAVSLDMARADALSLLGRKSEAERFTERALAINPMATDPIRKLIRFGHY